MSHGNTLSLGQQANFIAAVIKALPRDIHPTVARVWEQKDEALTEALREVLCLPSQFEYNEHGHTVFTVDGLDLTGDQEIERLTAAGFRVGKYEKFCLRSMKKDGYDKNHRLVARQQYKIALMPAWEIEFYPHRTTDALYKLGVEKYGYEKPLAGIAPRICEIVSYKHMEVMGFQLITVPHDGIEGPDGEPLEFFVYEQQLSVRGREPDECWSDFNAFAFLVPAS